MSKTVWLLVITFVLAFLLRIVALDIRPLGFTWDEAALGYNAYSLLQTGRDEHQKITPIIFESFGDYKPGLYVYLAVPSVAMFGLTEFATRLPSALIGSLSVVVIWFLVKELFGRKYGIFVSFIMAINPWSIYFSRGAWESNVMVFLLLLGAVLAIRNRLVLAAIMWGLSLWTYQGAKLVVPLVALGYWWFLGEKKQVFTHYWKPVFVAFLLALPLLANLKAQSGRLEVTNLFSYVRPSGEVDRILQQDNASRTSLVYYVFHSEKLDQIRGAVQRYLNHFSPRFLFEEGDWVDMRQTIAYYGYLHLPEVILLVLGITVLISQWDSKTKFLLWWLIVAVIPSALSRDAVSGVRALPLTIPLVAIIGLGLAKLTHKRIAFALYALVMMFFMIRFIDLYYIHAPFYKGDETLVMYRPTIELVGRHEQNYQNIIFSSKFGQPYIFVLFYEKTDPREFWKSVIRTSPRGVDVGEVTSFGKWQFGNFYWPDMRSVRSTIVVGDELELPEVDLHFPGVTKLGTILYPNGDESFKVVALQ